jgi:ABC-type tungstate transport system substrate-binding protein
MEELCSKQVPVFSTIHIVDKLIKAAINSGSITTFGIIILRSYPSTDMVSPRSVMGLLLLALVSSSCPTGNLDLTFRAVFRKSQLLLHGCLLPVLTRYGQH